jgi:anti-sigma factor RsiW
MTCADLDRLLTDWLRGALAEPEARDLEAHAAECPACEARLEQASRLSHTLAEPSLPPGLRHSVLGAVSAAHRRRRQRAWITFATGVAALVILGVAVQPRRKEASDVPRGAVILLAADRARPELEALDHAESELLLALRSAPSDAVLTHALEDLRRQRVELQRLVREAAS